MSEDLDDLLDGNSSNNVTIDSSTQQETLPNAAAVLVLGICSIPGCVLLGIGGLICGIIALILFKKTKTIYNTNPAKYENSFKNAKAGQVCAIIGTCISGLYFLIWIFYAIIVGSVIMGMPRV